MNTHLKRCPFCGGVATLQANYSYKTQLFFVFARCTLCHAQGKAYTDQNDPTACEWDTDACDDAMAAWNTRSNEENDT